MTSEQSAATRCRAESVTPEGELDGWTPELFYRIQAEDGHQRLAVSAPALDVVRILTHLVEALGGPVSVLYRQKIDRRDPKPQAHPGRDFVALDVEPQRAVAALRAASSLLAYDARSELWVRNRAGDQLILDQDGLVFWYGPIDVAVAALETLEVQAGEGPMISDRDYVKHWFHADCDAEEDGLIDALALTEIPVRS